jgi:putative nucleotidyltransferase with HDIG domain
MPVESARPTAPWALRLVPPFPSVAQRILALAGRTDVSIDEVSALARMDPSFSAELLRFANSALFSVRREISSLSHAILLLGLDRVTSIATFVVMNRMVSTSLNIPALRKVWIHSLVTAIIAEEAAQVARVACDSAYTAGLLHNLGTLGLMSAYPAEYARMLQVSDDYGFDLLATERDLFDIDHCAAGAFLAQEWDFPDELTAAIATHHDEPDPSHPALYNRVRASWRLADTFGYAAFSPDRLWDQKALTTLIPFANTSWLDGPIDGAQSEINKRLAAAAL